MDSKIVTADGTETFFNKEYNEAYHSTKAGAYTESLHKFINPTKIKELAKNQNQINILDVGFGLAYNVAVCYTEAIKVNPDIKLNIISIEKDEKNFERIKKFNIPTELEKAYQIINLGIFEKENVGKNEYKIYKVENKNLNLKVILGEGRQILKDLSLEISNFFDGVFYDAFSPKVNTEMWTVNIFKIVKNLMKEKAILATYSASLAVRKGLIEAGFKIGLVEPIGRKSYSTVATINGSIPPLTEKEEKRLKESPYATSYYDNENLDLPKEIIKENWEKRLKDKL
ncbi:tRNA (5-methylaminomethyl-2-thiouridine)(34)-methyltransferase MnmD [Hydrogenothermus marinus]|uniref:tRNA U34 5-methylaminomethyl-2-thiouridine-forming methyltransferase MnmC n=1 Tax=Hydrogenothermus marinus TaxID=133270 RepID=A0A3M0BLJ0_9AQUI|nr:MnmC family methyltransferase [Hydrogenothermus marinus]RMA97139.1 tRNA U34 5-methylaminomethyl-2-thiouridine-forming methyltransferase MnmC [Hydrogenothermus marinus]